jgi:hypothetical protein
LSGCPHGSIDGCLHGCIDGCPDDCLLRLAPLVLRPVSCLPSGLYLRRRKACPNGIEFRFDRQRIQS